MRILKAGLVLALLGGYSPTYAAEMIADGAFENGADHFWAAGGVSLSRQRGALCADIDAGGEPWDRLVGVNGIVLEPGKAYRLKATFKGKGLASFPLNIQRAEEPWTAQAAMVVNMANGDGSLSAVFEGRENEQAQMILHLGGADNPWTLCLDDVSLAEAGTNAKTPEVADELSALPALVNQSGYILDGPKRATIVSSAKDPLDFTLEDAEGIVVGKGRTRPAGFDITIGAETHVADFSTFSMSGEGYRIVVDGKMSYPFSVGNDIYGKLRVDALSWFYPQRSGIEIRGDIAGEAYARPAGHLQQRPNQGDLDVGCLSGPVAWKVYGDWSCDYTLDVSGGWYDAGDQGKYVVNGGIAVAQLMSTFERGISFGKGDSPVISDSLSRIPENGNGIPDILDEARWELEFLMKMMVPDGQPLAGMVHHKVHDTKWTGVPMMPHLDPELRALHRPSTAATLNLAAAAAQGARLFKPYDAEFAKRLLAAARKSFSAAEENPALYAPLTDGLEGGGDYEDDDVTDEVYWAAAELYITTGEAKYLKVLKASPHWSGPVFSAAGALNWRFVAGLGRLDLALYADRLPEADRRMIRNSVLSAAREFLVVQEGETFGQIYRPDNNDYAWGSNHLILQNMIVVAAAFDLTGQKPFLTAIRESMDYILGRNAMNISYVTGYGSEWSKNQHSRWYANQMDASLPNPPVGSLAGGPNSTMVDDVARAKLKGCVPQRCYADDIAAYGSNELTINWNAPLVYIASFLADVR